MTHRMIKFLTTLAVLGFGSPLLAQSSDVVIVMPLNAEAESRALPVEAARVLKPTKLVVLQGQALETAIQRRRAPTPSTEVMESLVTATQQIGHGIERFFYMLPHRAVPILQPALDVSWHNPEALAYRPDLSDQVWQAGIILLRAAADSEKNSKKKSAAHELAVQLITLMPSRATDPTVVPPEMRVVLEDARSEIAELKTTLRLQVVDPDCDVFLNGIKTTADQDIIVHPAGRYYVHSDCSLLTTPPIWRVPLEPESDNVILVPAVEPHRPTAHHVHPARERAIGEWYLRAATEMADATLAVGVSAVVDSDDIVLARFDRAERSIVWSDSDFAESIRRSMPTIFPEYTEMFAANAEDEATQLRDFTIPDKKPVDWFGVGFVGGGAVAAGLGTYFIVAAKRQGHLLDCAINNPTPPPGVDCSDVAVGTYFEDFNGELRSVGSARTAGWMLVGVGAASIGYGVYRLLRPPPRQAKAVRFEFHGTGMVLTW